MMFFKANKLLVSNTSFQMCNKPNNLLFMRFSTNCNNMPNKDVIRNGPISDYYAGKSVFVTGGTGFLGKVFIEKLLYSCKDIDKIYVLVRAANRMAAQRRIQQIIEKPLFTRLKNERPLDLDKIVPIVGDITDSNLGITREDEQTLLDKVSVVFHAAATVKFNEPLKVALNTNVEGTRRILDLSKRMKNIKMFVHVSTAYCNTEKEVIEEVVYPLPVTVTEVFNYVDDNDNDLEKNLKMYNGRPNTYTFSKALAEILVEGTHSSMPTVIIRPSMVIAAKNEPLVGWTDAWSVPTAVLVAIAKGLNRVIVGDKNNIVDFIPVDYVANLSIVAAARCNSSNEVTVYNCCTSVCNPITFMQGFNMFAAEGLRQGFNEFPVPGVVMLESKFLIAAVTFVLQTLPVHIADLWLRIRGREQRFVKLNKKAVFLRDFSQYFTRNTWLMPANNTQALAASLSAVDRELFPCDPADIDWNEFMPIYFHGVNNYLMKDKLTTRLSMSSL